MPEEDARAKGRIWEEKRVCSYCNKAHTGENLGFVHRNKDGHPDWSICFLCTKKFFDRVLKKETKMTEVVERCSYCDMSEDKYLLHMDENNNVTWFICYKCLKKALNRVLKGEQ